MSGGSWEYVYYKFEDVGARLQGSHDPHRQALGDLILRISVAMHDIEWVDSNDYGKGDEIDAIKKALGEDVADALALEKLVRKYREIGQEIEKLIGE